MTTEAIRIISIDRLDLRLESRPWRWADENRSAIEMHFKKVGATKQIWNGRVLLLHHHAIEAGVFYGSFFETDFANFLAWRDFGFPDPSIINCFAMGALRAADGTYLLGRMAKYTANAGKVYFPAGTPDPGDVRDGKVDLISSVTRELAEETGLMTEDVTQNPRWYAVLAGMRTALVRPIKARENAVTLASRIRAYLAREEASEFEDVILVRSSSDFVPEMPDFVRAYLKYSWSQDS
jgi:8-oxo-dGTP pyrophosphatase MutT (NUDIX family)